jgi:DNA-directed RNA polymerase subunit RPC12/RpoP
MTSFDRPIIYCPKYHSMNIYSDDESEIACDDCGYEVLRKKEKE